LNESFSYATLACLSNDRAVLKDFIKQHFTSITDVSVKLSLFLVALLKDYSVLVCDASDDSRSQEYIDLIKTSDDMYGWASLKSEVEAVNLQAKLESIDNKVALPDLQSILEAAASAQMRSSLPLVELTTAGPGKASVPVVNPYAKSASIHPATAASQYVTATTLPDSNSGVKFVSTNDPSSPLRSSGTSALAFSSSADALATLDMGAVNYMLDTNVLSEAGTGIKLRVSGVIPHARHGLGYVYVFMTMPDLLYYCEGKFFRSLVDVVVREAFTRKGLAPPMYLASLGDIATCIPSNPHEYKRSKKNWTVSIPFWVNEIPTNGASHEAHVKTAFSNLASGYRANSNCGANFAAWVKANKGVLYKRETGTDGSRKTISHEQFASLCQTRLVKAFKNVSIEWNYPLDRVITYGHIKKFLMETCGYSHWTEIPLHVKEYILGNATSVYPDWDECAVKPYAV
jgi:hypothetical protein